MGEHVLLDDDGRDVDGVIAYIFNLCSQIRDALVAAHHNQDIVLLDRVSTVRTRDRWHSSSNVERSGRYVLSRFSRFLLYSVFLLGSDALDTPSNSHQR